MAELLENFDSTGALHHYTLPVRRLRPRVHLSPLATAVFDVVEESHSSLACRHAAGDWGILDAPEWEENDRCIAAGHGIVISLFPVRACEEVRRELTTEDPDDIALCVVSDAYTGQAWICAPSEYPDLRTVLDNSL